MTAFCKWCAREFTPSNDKQDFCCTDHRLKYHTAARTYGQSMLEHNGMDKAGVLKDWTESRL